MIITEIIDLNKKENENGFVGIYYKSNAEKVFMTYILKGSGKQNIEMEKASTRSGYYYGYVWGNIGDSIEFSENGVKKDSKYIVTASGIYVINDGQIKIEISNDKMQKYSSFEPLKPFVDYDMEVRTATRDRKETIANTKKDTKTFEINVTSDNKNIPYMLTFGKYQGKTAEFYLEGQLVKRKKIFKNNGTYLFETGNFFLDIGKYQIKLSDTPIAEDEENENSSTVKRAITNFTDASGAAVNVLTYGGWKKCSLISVLPGYSSDIGSAYSVTAYNFWIDFTSTKSNLTNAYVVITNSEFETGVKYNLKYEKVFSTGIYQYGVDILGGTYEERTTDKNGIVFSHTPKILEIDLYIDGKVAHKYKYDIGTMVKNNTYINASTFANGTYNPYYCGYNPDTKVQEFITTRYGYISRYSVPCTGVQHSFYDGYWKTETGNVNTIEDGKINFNIKGDKGYILYNNTDEVGFSANISGEDGTALDMPVTYYVDGIPIIGNKYRTTVLGMHKVYGIINGGVKSNEIQVLAGYMPIDKIEITANKNYYYLNGGDTPIEIGVIAYYGNTISISKSEQINFDTYVNGIKIESNIFTPTAVGEYSIKVVPKYLDLSTIKVAEKIITVLNFMPDINFRAVVETNLGKTNVTVADVKNITALNLGGNVPSINGIGNFINLTSINFGTSKVKDIAELKNLKKINSITFMDNYLDETAVKTLEALKKLNNCIINGKITAGVIKIANSWGASWGDNGFFYITYRALKESKISGDYAIGRSGYRPKVLAVFNVESQARENLSIKIGIKNTDQYLVFNHVEKTSILHPISNILVFDITQLLPFTNNTLYLNIAGTGKIKSFAIEEYSSYGQNISDRVLVKRMENNNEAIISATGTNVELGNITISKDVAYLSPSNNSNTETMHLKAISNSELLEIKKNSQVFDSAINYNNIVNGMGTGLLPPTAEQLDRLSEIVKIVDTSYYTTVEALSSKVDNSAFEYFPAIASQDNKGTCAAFATGYYMAGYYMAKDRKLNVTNGLIEANDKGQPTKYLNRVLSPDFVYNLNKGDKSGTIITDNLRLIINTGICSWEQMPYKYDASDIDFENKYTDWPSETAFREAPLFKMAYPEGTKLGAIYPRDDSGVNAVKKELSEGKLLTLTVISGDLNLLTAKKVKISEKNIVYLPPDNNGHAVTAVGYDDNFALFGGN